MQLYYENEKNGETVCNEARQCTLQVLSKALVRLKEIISHHILSKGTFLFIIKIMPFQRQLIRRNYTKFMISESSQNSSKNFLKFCYEKKCVARNQHSYYIKKVLWKPTTHPENWWMSFPHFLLLYANNRAIKYVCEHCVHITRNHTQTVNTILTFDALAFGRTTYAPKCQIYRPCFRCENSR